MKHVLRLLAIFVLTLSTHAEAAKNICGEIKNAYGPFDYRLGRSTNAKHLGIVEAYHFGEEVETGTNGMTGTIGGDLDYTLRAFPNHMRALNTMVRLAKRDKVNIVRGAKYPVECYFDRAIRFQPDDAAVRATYGNYLFSVGQTQPAITMLTHAVQLEPDNATINYNLALGYLKVRDYSKANLYAQRAYRLGFPLPGLKNKLVEAGKWDDKIEIGTIVKAEKEEEGEAAPEADKAEADKADKAE